MLAFAALLFGASRAVGVEIDREALAVSEHNARNNGMDERFEALVAPPFHHLAVGLSAGDPGWLGRRVRVYWKGEHAFFAGSVHKADRVKVSA